MDNSDSCEPSSPKNDKTESLTNTETTLTLLVGRVDELLKRSAGSSGVKAPESREATSKQHSQNVQKQVNNLKGNRLRNYEKRCCLCGSPDHLRNRCAIYLKAKAEYAKEADNTMIVTATSETTS